MHAWPLNLSQLDTRTLIEATEKLARHTHQVTAELLLHLAEVESRGAYRDMGASSMFDYVQRRLGFCEGATAKRLGAARVVRQFPLAYTLLSAGKIHLSAVCLLRPCLTSENADMLLHQACGMSKRQVEVLVASLRPKPPESTVMRAQSTSQCELPAAAATRNPQNSTATSMPSGSSAAAEVAHKETPAVHPNVQATVPVTGHANTTKQHNVRATITPRSATSYTLRMHLTASTLAQLQELTALCAKQFPHGDPALLISHAIDVALTQAKKQRGLQPSPGPQMRDDKAVAPPPDIALITGAMDVAASASPAASHEPTAPRSRSIARAIKRAVYTRDQGQCCFVSDDGHRCDATRFLEYHHVHAFAKGGAHTVENIQLLCAVHNRLLAEREFGVPHVRHCIQRAAQRSSAGSAPIMMVACLPGMAVIG